MCGRLLEELGGARGRGAGFRMFRVFRTGGMDRTPTSSALWNHRHNSPSPTRPTRPPDILKLQVDKGIALVDIVRELHP